MGTSLAASAPPLASHYERWHRHFRLNVDSPAALPWNDSYQLTSAERRSVVRSIQQFELGEWARGRGLKRRAQSHDALAGDPWFLPALELFIQEEQGHSGMLASFLGSPRHPGPGNSLGGRRLPAVAKAGGSGGLRCRAGDGGSPSCSVLSGPSRCHAVAPAAGYLLAHSHRRSCALELSGPDFGLDSRTAERAIPNAARLVSPAAVQRHEFGALATAPRSVPRRRLELFPVLE